MQTRYGVIGRWAQSFLIAPYWSATETRGAAPPVHSASSAPRPGAAIAGDDDRAKLVQRFLDQGRTAILLRAQIAKTLEPDHLAVVKKLFHQQMAFVDRGEVVVARWTFEESEPTPGQGAKRHESVTGCYMDRCAVSNRQFREFVADGGYGQQSLWDAPIWSRVSEFVDRTGMPGPRFWQDGQFPAGDESNPVVGVNWFEAMAFARWTGRRLPTDAEWVKAAACPATVASGETVQRKFPWGDTPDSQRANLWVSGIGRTIGVSQLPASCSSVGINQLIGNAWEWTSSDLEITSYGRDVKFEVPLKSLRGGAFDTYFETQATCQLQSADSALARRHNVGFRCAMAAEDIVDLGVPA